MNEISFSAENARVMVLAATNRPSDLDEAIIRRFSQAFEIGKPSLSDRTKILKVVLKGERIEDNIDFDRLASLCEGYTGSDILEACKQAAFIPLREYLQDEKKGEQSQVALSPSIYIHKLPQVVLFFDYYYLLFLQNHTWWRACHRSNICAFCSDL